MIQEQLISGNLLGGFVIAINYVSTRWWQFAHLESLIASLDYQSR